MRRFAAPFTILIVIAILVVTLTPTGANKLQMNHLCMLCGERGLADALLNAVLFLPLGVALQWRGARFGRALAAALLLSALIEAAQLFIPGRDATISDIIFNAAGAGLGWSLMRWRTLWLLPERSRSRAMAGASMVLALMVLLIGAQLVKPDLPERTYYGQWTPEFGNLEHYDGAIIAAAVGDIRIRSDRIRRSADTRARLMTGVPLRVLGSAGHPPKGIAPIFNIYDDLQREVLMLAADENDFIFRYRSKAASFRLDQPAFRLTGAFEGIDAGDTLRLQVQRVDRGFCVQVNNRVTCPVGYSAAKLWLLLFATERAVPLIGAFDFLWLVLLFIPLGFWSTSERDLVFAIAASTAGLVGVSYAGGLLLPAPQHLIAVVTAIVSGWLLRSAHRRHELADAPLDAGVAVHEH